MDTMGGRRGGKGRGKEKRGGEGKMEKSGEESEGREKPRINLGEKT